MNSYIHKMKDETRNWISEQSDLKNHIVSFFKDQLSSDPNLQDSNDFLHFIPNIVTYPGEIKLSVAASTQYFGGCARDNQGLPVFGFRGSIDTGNELLCLY